MTIWIFAICPQNTQESVSDNNAKFPTNTIEELERTTQILRAPTKFNSKAYKSRAKKAASILRGLASRFEEIRLFVPIVSVHETKETRFREHAIRTLKVILAPQSLTTTKPHLEELMELPSDHDHLCLLQGVDGKLPAQLGNFVMRVMRIAPGVVEDKMRAFDQQSIVNESLALSNGSCWGEDMDGKGSDEANTGAATQPTKHTGSNFEMVPAVSDIYPTSRQAKLPCFLVEPRTRNKKFFGRADVLKRLDEELLPTDNRFVSSQIGDIGLRQFAICGVGGVGKTEIAAEWAYSRRAHFDAVFWIAADEASKLCAGFCQVALKLGLEDASLPQNQIVSRELVKGWLSNPKRTFEIGHDSDVVGQEDAKWLLIFDNAEDIDALDNYWPVGGNGSLLITSRDPLAKTAHSTAASYIDLEPFSKSEGAEYLRKLTMITGDDAKSEQIVERLGCLPMAISQMAGIIRAQYLSFSDFIERYEQEEDIPELHSTSIEATGQNYKRTIASFCVFDELSPAAQAVLKVTAFLDPDCIPEKIYTEGADIVVLDAYPRHLNALLAARAELLQASFVRRNAEKKEIWVHRLVQDAIRAKMSPEETEATVNSAFHLVSSLWPSTDISNRHVIASWKQREELYPHVMTITNLYRQLFDRGALKPHLPLAALLNDAVWWQHERGNSHEVKPILQLGLRICEKIEGEKSVSLKGDLHHTLGALSHATNDPAGCLRHNEELFKIRQASTKMTGVRDFRYAISHMQYATALMMNKEISRAIQLYKKAIDEIRKLPEFRKQMLSIPTADLGFALCLAGELEEASTYLEQAIKDREEIFGPDDTESYRLGFLQHALGNVRWCQERYSESFELHQKSLRGYKATIGDHHHRTADVCHRVAKHYIRLGFHTPAIELINKALKAWLVDRRSYKPEIARTSFLKSKVCNILGDEAGAAQASQTAQDLVSELTGRSMKQIRGWEEADYDELVAFWSK